MTYTDICEGREKERERERERREEREAREGSRRWTEE